MMTELKKEIDNMNNLVETENGALGYKSTGKDLVDLNFRIPSMRTGLSGVDIEQFTKALHENLEYAVKWMFFTRDFRGNGLGERDTFVELYTIFFNNYPVEAKRLLGLISEYGRWSDVIDIAFSGDLILRTSCIELIGNQLKEDITNLTNGKPISLLAKWMPSINATKFARKRAIEICNQLVITKGNYRKMLSKLRAYLDVTERKTCGNKWSEIDYNKVSSNANLRYSDAFMKHDEVRRRKYLDDLTNPTSETKAVMHVQDLFPHEIWHKYVGKNGTCYGWYRPAEDIDENPALEAMWQNLKDIGNGGNTLCVCDGSGSMSFSLPNSSATALDVSRALSVYFAERCTGEFKNQFIEFSSTPQFIDVRQCDTLAQKIKTVLGYNDCSNTDIAKVFRLVLNTAVKNNMSQEDLPERILIISDMEFDCVRRGYRTEELTETLFDTLRKEYEDKGYKFPKLVFWNVNSRTNTIPVMENELGVALVSGYSVNILNLVMSNETDPWLILKETLDSERYQPISDILKEFENE